MSLHLRQIGPLPAFVQLHDTVCNPNKSLSQDDTCMALGWLQCGSSYVPLLELCAVCHMLYAALDARYAYDGITTGAPLIPAQTGKQHAPSQIVADVGQITHLLSGPGAMNEACSYVQECGPSARSDAMHRDHPAWQVAMYRQALRGTWVATMRTGRESTLT